MEKKKKQRKKDDEKTILQRRKGNELRILSDDRMGWWSWEDGGGVVR